jgi:TfoX/Sxy family transcriptional regulator of competence genes
VARDKELEERVEALLPVDHQLERKSMFGGMAFLDRGNLCFGVSASHLLVRVGEEGSDEALKRPGARVMVMRDRPMTGWIQVDPPGYESDGDLKLWMAKAMAFAATLPSK